MIESNIAFPNLGLYFDINNVAISIGNLSIYWYALIIVTGIISAYFFAARIAKKEDISADTLSDVVLWAIPSAIVFARVYYVIFNFADYKNNFGAVFNIRGGGIAIYGAIIGACLSTYIYSRVKKISIWKVLDVGAFGLIIGQAVGRWGNFVNQEAYGGNTNNIFAMTGGKIKDDLIRMQNMGLNVDPNMGVHPTFLYESLWNFFGLAVLIFVYKKLGKNKKDGQIFLSYLIWYGLGRYFIEGLRLDSLMFYQFRISQVLAGLSVIVCSVLLYLTFKNVKFRKLSE